jgi:hypothetical protein
MATPIQPPVFFARPQTTTDQQFARLEREAQDLYDRVLAAQAQLEQSAGQPSLDLALRSLINDLGPKAAQVAACEDCCYVKLVFADIYTRPLRIQGYKSPQPFADDPAPRRERGSCCSLPIAIGATALATLGVAAAYFYKKTNQ